MKKYIGLILALLLVASMTACAGASVTESTPATTETTVPTETTEATEAPVDTEEKLNAALNASPYAKLDASLTLEKTIVLHAGELDGNGYTLTGPAYVEDDISTENGVAMKSGRLKNITIVDAYRCLGDTKENPQTGDIFLENVTLDGSNYALNFGQGGYTNQLIAENSKLYGWSSYTGFSAALFENCTFGWDSTGSNGNLRPYVDTVLSGCHFESKTEEDGTVVPFRIALKESITGISITLEDCYVGDTLITEENVNELLFVEVFSNSLYITNTESE